MTINIKPGLKWSDGTPVDGQDVAFYYYVLKAATNASPANWCQYASPTQFPYNVKSISYSGNTVVDAPDGRGQPDLVHLQPAAGHQRRRLPAARDRLERQRQPAST